MQIELVQSPLEKVAENTIYVDGAWVNSFIDIDKNSYSFDHHGEFRFDKTSASFQTAMAILQGLDVTTIENVYVSSVDADSVLSIMTIMHPEVVQNLKFIRLLQDLSRIDNHGPPAVVPGEAFAQYHFDLSDRNSEQTTELLLKLVDRAWELYNNLELYVEGVEKTFPGFAYALNNDGTLKQMTNWSEANNEKGGVSFSDVYRYSPFGMIISSEFNGAKKVTIGKKPFARVKSLKTLWPILTKNEEDPENYQWGGADSIGGSPFKKGTLISTDDILKIIHEWTRLI